MNDRVDEYPTAPEHPPVVSPEEPEKGDPLQ